MSPTAFRLRTLIRAARTESWLCPAKHLRIVRRGKVSFATAARQPGVTYTLQFTDKRRASGSGSSPPAAASRESPPPPKKAKAAQQSKPKIKLVVKKRGPTQEAAAPPPKKKKPRLSKAEREELAEKERLAEKKAKAKAKVQKWLDSLKVGSDVEAADFQGRWIAAKIVAFHGKRVRAATHPPSRERVKGFGGLGLTKLRCWLQAKVHFIGWNSRHDEEIFMSGKRLRKPGSK